MQVSFCSSTAYRKISPSPPSHTSNRKMIFPSAYSQNFLPLMSQCQQSRQCPHVRCERVHFGHLSLPSSQSGSLPLGFFSRTNMIYSLHLRRGPTSPVFQATLLIVHYWVFSAYFQSHLLRCGSFPNNISPRILPSPPLQSRNTPNPCLYVLCSLRATHINLNPLNLFCLSTSGQAV